MIEYRQDNHTFVICGDQYFYGHINLFVWTGVISTTCFYLAYKTRSIPDNFRESKYIFISTIIITIIGISTIIIDFYTTDLLTIILDVINIIAFGASPLICLFFPKLYIIIFRSQQNTVEQTMTDISHFTFKMVWKQEDANLQQSSYTNSSQKVISNSNYVNHLTSISC